MASLFSYQLLLRPVPRSFFSSTTSALSSLPDRIQFPFFPRTPLSGLHRREYEVATLSMGANQLDFGSGEVFARDLLSRVEGAFYSLADASISSSFPTAAEEVSKQRSDWLSGITNSLETILKIFKDGLSALHIPYAYGFAIIFLTVFVKAATFPLTKKQFESTLAMKSLQTQVKAIQQLYAGDQERIQIETARLYKLAGVNPLAGCLPTLATIPVWVGLYRALTNVANEGLLNEGFFWIPSLAGPTTIAARQNGSGTSWLFPFVGGDPPLGWSDTLAYLVLPVLLVVSQYISAQIMQPSQDIEPSQKSSQAVLKLLPLMIGYFALSVPSGLSLYWFTNNILSTAQQIWLQKLGGAKNPVKQFGDERTEKTSNILSSLSDIQKSTLVENKKNKSSIESDSSAPRLGERFKQIKEEEARRKQQEEAGCRAVEEIRAEISEAGVSSTYIDKNKMDDENSGNHQIHGHLSNTTNGSLHHSSMMVKQDESSGEEMQPEETHAAPASPTYASESVDKRDQTVEKEGL